ncbi:MAG TPA: hypothetical protein VFC95_00975, partial [Guyparkeria sp.]|nr:hypothetical protein [Guyparkeria sp.]
MSTLKNLIAIPVIAAAIISASAMAGSEALIDAMEGYVMFADYQGGTIRPEQIPAEDWKNMTIVDTRDAEQYQEDHIPG